MAKALWTCVEKQRGCSICEDGRQKRTREIAGYEEVDKQVTSTNVHGIVIFHRNGAKEQVF